MTRYTDERSDTRYIPTPTHVSTPQDFTVPIDEQLTLRTHLEVYKDLVRQFSITLTTSAGEEIARIDTDHSVVHRHQFYRDGGQDRPPHFIERIPEGIDGAKVVDRMYKETSETMYDQAHEMFRRWAQ